MLLSSHSGLVSLQAICSQILQTLCLCLALSLLLLGSGGARATDNQLSILIKNVDSGELDLSSHVELFWDATGQTSLENIAAQPGNYFRSMEDAQAAPRFGLNTYWVRLRLREGVEISRYVRNWILVLETTDLTQAALYVREKSGYQAFSPSEPGTAHSSVFQRVSPLLDRHLVYSLSLGNDYTSELYLKVKVRGRFNLPVTLWSADEYQRYKRQTLPAWGLFFGGMLALILYNLFLWVSLSQRTYIYLAAFLISSVLVTAASEGFLGHYLSGFTTSKQFDYCAYLQCLALICAVAFTRSYLGTKKDYPQMDKVLIAVVAGAIALAAGIALEVMPQPWFVVFFLVCSAFFFVPAVIASLNVTERATHYFLAGWSVFMLAYVIYQFGVLGIVPINTLTMKFKEPALCILGITLSLGIAAQIQRERFEKRKGVSLQQETMLELKYAEEQLQKKVLRDTLHDFPDINTLENVANGLIVNKAGSDNAITLVLIELHHLVQIEKQLGHAAKNELLTRATKRLSIVLRGIVGVVPLAEFKRQYIPMAVLGSGEYAFLLHSMDESAVNMAIEEVESAMQRPFFYQGVSLQPGVSFGVAKLGEVANNFNSLLKHSLVALTADKSKNMNKGYFLQSVNQYNRRNISLINELRACIQDDLITLFFQPIYDLRSNQVCGIEVLTRWESESEQGVTPNETFYLAEVGGFISELTLKIIEQAIHYYLLAVDPTRSSLKLSINLSPKCLREDGFIEQVGFLLEKNHIPAKILSFEIKESAIIEDPNITRETLKRIRSMGIGLTIDEFGAAYSNPTYMSNLPVTEVKLDQRLIGNLDNPYHRESLVEMVSLCRAQDIKLVIHGIEDETTFNKLESLGCNFAQGHYLAEPVKAADFRLPRIRTKKLVQH